jgi:hypothetical protein
MFLIVDLDGTLLRNDYFIERFMLNPREWIRFNLLKSKHILLDNFCPSKKQLMATVNPCVLQEILRFNDLKCVKVVSASPDLFVKYIVSELDLNIEGYGSLEVNLKGIKKLDFIKENNWVPFTYIGDSVVDDVIGRDSSCLNYIKL